MSKEEKKRNHYRLLVQNTKDKKTMPFDVSCEEDELIGVKESLIYNLMDGTGRNWNCIEVVALDDEKTSNNFQ